jgi:hyperosmotically inducible periplasmic protein
MLDVLRRPSPAHAVDGPAPGPKGQKDITMKTAILVVLGLTLAGAGCNSSSAEPNPSARAADAPPDNTKKNGRDVSGNTLTPMDQGGSEVDRTITQQIRQGVMKDDSLSMTAKNVKIITVDGVVTLRGPVKSAEERTRIASLAQQAANVKRVDNQLEIAAN